MLVFASIILSVAIHLCIVIKTKTNTKGAKKTQPPRSNAKKVSTLSEEISSDSDVERLARFNNYPVVMDNTPRSSLLQCKQEAASRARGRGGRGGGGGDGGREKAALG